MINFIMTQVPHYAAIVLALVLLGALLEMPNRVRLHESIRTLLGFFIVVVGAASVVYTAIWMADSYASWL